MEEEYIKRINKVFQYIDAHIHSKLSLSTIASVACYSPYHLHRLFKAISGETLNNYINRKRIESAAMMLVHHHEHSISDIGSKYGFTSDSSFTRSFKKIYHQSPSQFRKLNRNTISKISKTNSKKGQVEYISENYLRNMNDLNQFIQHHAKVEICEVTAMHLAYLTQRGEKGIENTFARVLQWANAKNVLSQADTYVCRVFHDSFKVTDADKVRMSIGIASIEALPLDEAFSKGNIEKGKTLVAHFCIDHTEFGKAWDSVFLWMHEKGYKKAERFPFELYHNNPMQHPENKYLVDLCIPIQ